MKVWTFSYSTQLNSYKRFKKQNLNKSNSKNILILSEKPKQHQYACEYKLPKEQILIDNVTSADKKSLNTSSSSSTTSPNTNVKITFSSRPALIEFLNLFN